MAAALVGGAFLSSFVNVVFDRLSSPEVVNWIKGKKLDEKLLGRLKRILTVVRVVLNDAEQKQITDPAVKDWLADLEDAVYKADDLLDEFATKAATTHKDPGFKSQLFNSDHAKFLKRLGILSIDVSYGRDFSKYHAAFNCYDWMTLFQVPLFHPHMADYILVSLIFAAEFFTLLMILLCISIMYLMQISYRNLLLLPKKLMMNQRS